MSGAAQMIVDTSAILAILPGEKDMSGRIDLPVPPELSPLAVFAIESAPCEARGGYDRWHCEP